MLALGHLTNFGLSDGKDGQVGLIYGIWKEPLMIPRKSKKIVVISRSVSPNIKIGHTCSLDEIVALIHKLVKNGQVTKSD